jgi:TonB family protein
MHIRLLLLTTCLFSPFVINLAAASDASSKPASSMYARCDGTKSDPDVIVFRKGIGLMPPRIIKRVDPNYSEAARKAGLEGNVILKLVVDKDGSPRNICIERSLRDDLDQNSARAVAQWRFDPATKDGEPVATWISAETSFHFYRRLF